MSKPYKVSDRMLLEAVESLSDDAEALPIKAIAEAVPLSQSQCYPRFRRLWERGKLRRTRDERGRICYGPLPSDDLDDTAE